MEKQFGLAPISPASLRKDVLHSLRYAILTGTLRPGDRLLEEALAKELAVSRGTLREVMRQLEQEGLIETFPHRGSFVTKVNFAEIQAVLELRAQLEATAVRAALHKGAQELLPELERLIDEMHAGTKSGDMVQLAEADVAFHQLIVGHCGYASWSRIWQTIDGMVRLYIFTVNRSVPQFLVGAAESHRPIVAALAVGDADAAEAAVRLHICETLPWAQANTAVPGQP